MQYIESVLSWLKSLSLIDICVILGLIALLIISFKLLSKRNARIKSLENELNRIREFSEAKKRKQDYTRDTNNNSNKDSIKENMENRESKSLDFDSKLKLIKQGNFKIKDMMNNNETFIYWELVKQLKGNAFIVCPQVAFKAFLEKINDDEIWKVYSNFVADFLIYDRDSKKPIYIVEFHGSGHKGEGFARDEIERGQKRVQVEQNDTLKANLLNKVNIGYIELKGDRIYCDTDSSRIDKARLEKEIASIAQKIKQTKV